MSKTNKPGIDRRTILKGSTALAAGAIFAPAVISRSALASSGELNFMGWAGYPDVAAKVLPKFKEVTGITVNFTEVPDQDTMQAQAKLALDNGSVDVVEPTVDRIGGWASAGLVQPWDMSKISLDNYLPGLADGAMGEMATINGGRMILLSVWGTEAIIYSKAERPTEYGKASLGDLWDPANKGKVCIRPHSSLVAMGRFLESTGKLPKPWLDSYKDEATMKELWDIALAEAIKVKENVVQFWSGENEAQAAYKTNGALVGMNWDSTGFNLRNDGFGYIAPKEGAIAWNQGFGLMAKAKNVEQAHEWAKWIATPEGSAAWASAFGANPIAKGGIDLLSAEVKDFYNSALPGDAVQKLWWWPEQQPWFIKLRGEYADKWKAA